MYKFIRFILSTLLALAASSAQAQSILDLAQGPPSNQDILGKRSYESFDVYRPPSARVFYVNNDLLKAMGINTSNLTKQILNDQILEAFAWTSETIADTSGQTRKAYADYYGGDGIGNHKGSARAGIIGQVQLKGIGLTPMHDGYIKADKDGSASMHEGIKEVVWGEFLHRLLPYGANRVIAIIDTGTVNYLNEPRVIIVRQNPLRAGHFVERPFTSDAADELRAKHIRTKLPNVLQHRNASEAKLLNGLSLNAKATAHVLAADEWLFRVTKQLAKAHLQRVYHGAMSESNININGQFIDYGTATTNSGFGAVRFLQHVDPFGVYGGDIHSQWGPGLVSELLKDISGLPNDFYNAVERVYGDYLKQAFLEETLRNFGLPDSKIATAFKNNEIRKLAELLFKVTEYKRGSEIFDIQDNPMPKSTSEALFRELLLQLASSLDSPNQLKLKAEELKIDPALLKEISQQWKKAASHVRVVMSDFASPVETLKHKIHWENRDRSVLYRDKLRESTRQLNGLLKTGNADAIEKINRTIDNLIEDAQPRWIGIDSARFIPIRVIKNIKGESLVEFYDSKTNKNERMRFDESGSLVTRKSINPTQPEPLTKVETPKALSCKQIFTK